MLQGTAEACVREVSVHMFSQVLEIVPGTSCSSLEVVEISVGPAIFGQKKLYDCLCT